MVPVPPVIRRASGFAEREIAVTACLRVVRELLLRDVPNNTSRPSLTTRNLCIAVEFIQACPGGVTAPPRA